MVEGAAIARRKGLRLRMLEGNERRNGVETTACLIGAYAVRPAHSTKATILLVRTYRGRRMSRSG